MLFGIIYLTLFGAHYACALCLLLFPPLRRRQMRRRESSKCVCVCGFWVRKNVNYSPAAPLRRSPPSSYLFCRTKATCGVGCKLIRFRSKEMKKQTPKSARVDVGSVGAMEFYCFLQHRRRFIALTRRERKRTE
jgi:hypothetical protein